MIITRNWNSISSFALAIALCGATHSQQSYAACTTQCNNAQTGFTNAQNQQSSYTNSGLGVGHMLIVMLNNGFGNLPLDVMNHFIYDMGMPTTNLTLPYTTTKTFNGNTVVLTVTSPTESFASTNGYTLKAVVSYNSATFMTMWWGGSGASAKGYMTVHSSGFNPNNAMYLQFDLTNSAAQVIKVFGGKFATPASAMAASGDNLIYGRINYNMNNSAITAQAMYVPNQSGSILCHRIAILSPSVLGSSLTLAFNTGGSALNSSSAAWATKDATGFSASTFVDATSTASGTAVSSPTISLDYSCANIYASVAAGGFLANGDASDSIAPATVFPN